MRMTQNKSKCYATNPKCLEGKERALLDGQSELMAKGKSISQAQTIFK